MTLASTLSGALMTVADQPFLLFGLIVLATFVLEDIATIVVAVLASRMVIDAPTAMVALVIGTAGGDLALYAAARWLRGWAPVARRMAKLDGTMPIRWLHRHAILAVVAARFIPGTRLPVFAGAGGIGVPARPFALAVIGSTLVWTPALYLLAAKADMQVVEGLGTMSWVAVAAAATALLLLPRLLRTLPREVMA
jgi:membrane protein DedA with SNARE-associated domain